MKKLVYGAYSLGALFALQHTPYVFGQTAAPAAAPAVVAQADTGPQLSQVIVTGTRQTGVQASDSPAPIQVIDSQTLQRTGQTDVMQALGAVIPSFTVDAIGADTANLSLSARLRGLSPNDALVLVNGKRRHTTANLHVDGGSPSSGAAAADLSFIPLSQVDHVEVLLDGAAAQYGTDAIAGVINIILKKANHGGALDLTAGKYYDGGGKSPGASFNVGVKPLDNAYLNLSLEDKYHGHSNRGAEDARFTDPANLNNAVNGQLVNFPDYQSANKIQGDAAFHLTTFGFNSGLEVSDTLSFYSFGTWGHKQGEGFENYRLPSRSPLVYPTGFNPLETLNETDYAITAGAKGVISGWNWDFSATHGADLETIGTKNSVNASLNGQYVPTGTNPGFSQTDFKDGTFRTGQQTVNLDITRDFEVGMTAPLTIAGGLEYRKDRYDIGAGDPESYYLSGAQSFVGYSPINAGKYTRNDKSAYVDVAITPLKDWLIDLAARYEDYNDFGNAKVGKLTTRYDVTPSFAVRGTVSNGFRAPTLAEQYYSGNNVGPTSIYLQLPPNSAAAKSFGLQNLRPEKSDNLSLGIVLKPATNATLTFDAYQIILKDRILASGSFDGYIYPNTLNQAILNGLTAAGVGSNVYAVPNGSAGVSFFTNGANTRTRGIDVVGTLSSDYGIYGKVDWSLAGNYGTTKITKSDIAPAILGGGPILSLGASSALTNATPKFRITGGGLWKYGQYGVSLRETVYGPSSYDLQDNSGNYGVTKISTKFITDLEVSDQITKGWMIAAGAKNLFNTYPNKINSTIYATFLAAHSNANVTQYAQNSPFGINGGFYYVRAKYSF